MYLGFRDTNTPIYHWVIRLGFENEIGYLRNSFQGIYLPDWFIYSVPDGLWMFAFVMSVLSIWDFKLNKTTGKWVISAVIIGIGFELMQSVVKGLGVFDWKDLLIMILSIIIALTMFTNKMIPEFSTNKSSFNKIVYPTNIFKRI